MSEVSNGDLEWRSFDDVSLDIFDLEKIEQSFDPQYDARPRIKTPFDLSDLRWKRGVGDMRGFVHVKHKDRDFTVSFKSCFPFQLDS